MTKEEILNEIDDLVKDDYNGTTSGTSVHKILSDITEFAADKNDDGNLIPEGATLTVEMNYKYMLSGQLKVDGTIVGDGIIEIE